MGSGHQNRRLDEPSDSGPGTVILLNVDTIDCKVPRIHSSLGNCHNGRFICHRSTNIRLEPFNMTTTEAHKYTVVQIVVYAI